MPTAFAVTAILALALAIGFLNMARNPKLWRLRWMEVLGAIDDAADRTKKRAQEQQMALIFIFMVVLFSLTSLSCAYWTYDQLQEQRRQKTGIEREIELMRQEIEGVSKGSR